MSTHAARVRLSRAPTSYRLGGARGRRERRGHSSAWGGAAMGSADSKPGNDRCSSATSAAGGAGGASDARRAPASVAKALHDWNGILAAWEPCSRHSAAVRRLCNQGVPKEVRSRVWSRLVGDVPGVGAVSTDTEATALQRARRADERLRAEAASRAAETAAHKSAKKGGDGDNSAPNDAQARDADGMDDVVLQLRHINADLPRTSHPMVSAPPGPGSRLPRSHGATSVTCSTTMARGRGRRSGC